MGLKRRGVRDGTGPFGDSYWRKIKKQKTGKRKLSGQKCPKK